MSFGSIAWRAAFLLTWAGSEAFAAGSVNPNINPYALPTVYPNYPSDSTFKVTQPLRATPVPVEVPPLPTTPKPETAKPSQPQSGSTSVSGTGVYSGGTGSAPPAGASSSFSSDQAPIVDPASVPKEITFVPHKAGSSASAASPLPLASPSASPSASPDP